MAYKNPSDVQPPELHELRTVNQLLSENPALTPGAVRWDIFNADKNGLSEAGAIVRRGRRILISPRLYLHWMVHGKTSSKSRASCR